MFVVTFYSYKGGVGRTMALVNIAVAEARLGKRVLVVDFDLEAPSLPSYKVFESSGCGSGVVDYITSYRETGIAPDAQQFISQCDVDGAPIWIMPAGRHTDAGYTVALNSIDWQDLYEHQEGYLMFEDLKRQWESLDFDYVLIDSRTGHTDVGGICTRQLPDAVVIMFLPTTQNIGGLGPIVDSIIEENKARKKDIALHFCASNVPDLDDEKGILTEALNSASERLYKEDPITIVHHYSSLDVLTQTAFVQSRPNSRLSKEYETLRQAIVSLNFEDREGAIVSLQGMPDVYEAARQQNRTKVRDKLLEQTRDIRSFHPNDGEIAFLAARVLSDVGDSAGEIEALNVAIERGFSVDRSRLARAYCYLAANQPDTAIEDLTVLLQTQTATVFEVGPALQLLNGIRGWKPQFEVVLDRPDEDFATVVALSNYILSIREALPAMARRFERSIDSTLLTPRMRRYALNHAILCHIGSGNFARAKELIAIDPTELSPNITLQDLFNYGIADWGETGAPNSDLFATVIEQALSLKGLPAEDSNVRQCLALAHSVVGDKDAARQALQDALSVASQSPGEMVFDCWLYLNVFGEEMMTDLNEMSDVLAADKTLEPKFFGEVRRLLN